MGWLGRSLNVLFGPTQRWVFVLIIARKPTRNDLPPEEDFLGPLPYRKVAVYSSIEKAMHASAWEAILEGWEVKEDEGGRPSEEEKATKTWSQITEEKHARYLALVEPAKKRAEAAKEAMLKSASWHQYESTDGKMVWVFAGPVVFDYRIIANRVDRWGELPSDTPAWIKRSF
jgi:hypothetical protein